MSSCGTVAQDLPPKFANTFVPEPSLGSGVVWVVEKGSAKGSGELWFPLGQVGSESYSVQVSLARGGLARSLDDRPGLLFAHVMVGHQRFGGSIQAHAGWPGSTYKEK